jgi:hypothetical protein
MTTRCLVVSLFLVACAPARLAPAEAPAPVAPEPVAVAKRKAPTPVAATATLLEKEPDGLSPQQQADAFETTKDPFNSATVDENTEGKLIVEKVLTLPQPDPPPSP